MTRNQAAEKTDITASESAVAANADRPAEADEAFGARFPLRLLRPAARRLRAPHRINSIAVCRGFVTGS